MVLRSVSDFTIIIWRFIFFYNEFMYDIWLNIKYRLWTETFTRELIE